MTQPRSRLEDLLYGFSQAFQNLGEYAHAGDDLSEFREATKDERVKQFEEENPRTRETFKGALEGLGFPETSSPEDFLGQILSRGTEFAAGSVLQPSIPGAGVAGKAKEVIQSGGIGALDSILEQAGVENPLVRLLIMMKGPNAIANAKQTGSKISDFGKKTYQAATNPREFARNLKTDNPFSFAYQKYMASQVKNPEQSKAAMSLYDDLLGKQERRPFSLIAEGSKAAIDDANLSKSLFTADEYREFFKKLESKAKDSISNAWTGNSVTESQYRSALDKFGQKQIKEISKNWEKAIDFGPDVLEGANRNLSEVINENYKRARAETSKAYAPINELPNKYKVEMGPAQKDLKRLERMSKRTLLPGPEERQSEKAIQSLYSQTKGDTEKMRELSSEIKDIKYILDVENISPKASSEIKGIVQGKLDDLQSQLYRAGSKELPANRIIDTAKSLRREINWDAVHSGRASPKDRAYVALLDTLEKKVLDPFFEKYPEINDKLQKAKSLAKEEITTFKTGKPGRLTEREPTTTVLKEVEDPKNWPQLRKMMGTDPFEKLKQAKLFEVFGQKIESTNGKINVKNIEKAFDVPQWRQIQKYAGNNKDAIRSAISEFIQNSAIHSIEGGAPSGALLNLLEDPSNFRSVERALDSPELFNALKRQKTEQLISSKALKGDRVRWDNLKNVMSNQKDQNVLKQTMGKDYPSFKKMVDELSKGNTNIKSFMNNSNSFNNLENVAKQALGPAVVYSTLGALIGGPVSAVTANIPPFINKYVLPNIKAQLMMDPKFQRNAIRISENAAKNNLSLSDSLTKNIIDEVKKVTLENIKSSRDQLFQLEKAGQKISPLAQSFLHETENLEESFKALENENQISLEDLLNLEETNSELLEDEINLDDLLAL